MIIFVLYKGKVIDSVDSPYDDKDKAIAYAKSRVLGFHGDNAPYHEFIYHVSRKP